MLQTAAEIGLSPVEFWGKPDDIYSGMTIREFSIYVAGYRRRFENQMEQLARVCANIMSCWSKKPVKMEHLLPKKKKEVIDRGSFKDPDDAISHLNQIRDAAEQKGVSPVRLEGEDTVKLNDSLDLSLFLE